MVGDLGREPREAEIEHALVERAAKADVALRKSYPSYDEERFNEILATGLRGSLPHATEEQIQELLSLARARGEELRTARGAGDIEDRSDMGWFDVPEAGSQSEVTLNTPTPQRSRQELVEIFLDKGLDDEGADECADAVLAWLTSWEER